MLPLSAFWLQCNQLKHSRLVAGKGISLCLKRLTAFSQFAIKRLT